MPHVLELRGLAQPGELLEHLVHVGADALAAREQVEVRVELRRPRVVVAGAEVHVAHELARLAAHDERHLRVRLVADDTVHHVRADFLEARRPVDVRLLVEARHELDDHGDLLAGARRVDERLHDHRIRAGAVHRLLDRDHLRIARRLADELDHRRERLERAVQQDVVLADDVEELASFRDRLRQSLDERLELEVGPVHLLGHAHEAHEVHRSCHDVEIVALEAELREEEARHRLRHVVGDFEAYGVAEMALRQFALQRLAQVLHLLLLDEEIGVARDAELIRAQHRHAGEELTHVRVQDRGEEDEVVGTGGDVVRQADDARQHARRLHDRGARIAPERVAAFELDREIEALVEDARERVRRVEPDGRQHRHHFAEEVVADPFLLRRRPLGAAQEADLLLRERGEDLVVQQPVLLLDDALHLRRDLPERLQRREPVRSRRDRAHLDLLLQPRDADLEELVQVGGDDAQEAQALEQRHRAVLGLREDAAIEFEDLQLAVEEVLVRQSRRGAAGGRLLGGLLSLGHERSVGSMTER